MTNPANLHLLLNHWPIIGTMITFALFLVALVGGRDDFKQASLALFSLIALLAIPAYLSGYAAQEALKEAPDVSMALIQTHQGAALLAFAFMEFTGAVSLVGLWRFSRTVKNPFKSGPGRLNLLAVLVLASVTVGLMAITGNTVGNIRHVEILSGPEPTSSVGAVGQAIIPHLQHFVIDSS